MKNLSVKQMSVITRLTKNEIAVKSLCWRHTYGSWEMASKSNNNFYDSDRRKVIPSVLWDIDDIQGAKKPKKHAHEVYMHKKCF